MPSVAGWFYVVSYLLWTVASLRLVVGGFDRYVVRR